MSATSKSPLSYLDVHQAFEQAGRLGELRLAFDSDKAATIWTMRANAYRVLLRKRSAEEGKDHISPFDHLMITIPREDRSQRLIRPRGYNFVAFGPDGEEVVLSKESITSPVRVTRRTGAEVFEDFLQEVEDELAAKRGDDE